ncbi:MAG: hypothetical protein NTV45_03285 [Firmicutes bacterium]|nr:hypothetical protein [Bacillota bacterium]
MVIDTFTAPPVTAPKVSLKKQLWVFLLITFGLTYTLNSIGVALYGPIASANLGSKWGMLLGFQMLLPAASAIISMGIYGIMFLGILAALLFKYGKWQADPMDSLYLQSATSYFSISCCNPAHRS